MDGSVVLDGRVPDAATPDTGGDTCTGDPEWCDGRDNDCDGVVDNGEPCPDSSVRHTMPYDGAVWMEGEEDGGCDPSWIQRVWPTVAPEGARLGCDRVRHFEFSPRAGELHFATGDGIVRYHSSGEHVPIPTPPCFDGVNRFGFDAMDRLYYDCDDTIRRDDGELLGSGEYPILAVLGSGKLIVQEYETVGSATRLLNGYALLDTDLTVLSRVDLEEWVGRHESLPS